MKSNSTGQADVGVSFSLSFSLFLAAGRKELCDGLASGVSSDVANRSTESTYGSSYARLLYEVGTGVRIPRTSAQLMLNLP